METLLKGTGNAPTNKDRVSLQCGVCKVVRLESHTMIYTSTVVATVAHTARRTQRHLYIYRTGFQKSDSAWKGNVASRIRESKQSQVDTSLPN